MMMGALIHQHPYNTVLNDKSNDVLVLSCNADLAKHLIHCKKSFLYISRMLIGVLSHQHTYNTVYNDKSYVVLVLSCKDDLARYLNHCKKVAYIFDE